MPEELSKTTAFPDAIETKLAEARSEDARWVRWALPSISDVFFLVLLGILAFSSMSSGLLGDADTGWHIRNGEFILASHSVPRTDSFSYTKTGQPWYAWEWLYDVVIAAVHHLAGLNGVVLFTAVLIAGTFALLFRVVLRRSGSFVVAVGLTLLSAAAAQIHMLARPHVFSWLFTLLWVEFLYRFEEGERSALLWLPVLMLVWVNVHGGFILGIMLIALFGCAQIWDYVTGAASGARQRIIDLSIVFCSCSAITLLTPYGYKLHVHVYQYLSSNFLMDSINEFMSPNFHAAGFGYFELFLLLSVFGLALARSRVALPDLLLLLFSIHAALYAARNIPISAIIISLSIGPMLAGVISPKGDRPNWIQESVQAVHEISENMAGMERKFRGHVFAAVVLLVSIAVACNGGRVWSLQIMDAKFDGKKFPVKATEFISRLSVHDHLFTTDYWSGYVIYRLYPSTKLCFDDRHDFYGEAFVKGYVLTINGGELWRDMLDQYGVKWVLVPKSLPLSTVLKESKDWQVKYDDGMAIVFAR